MAIGVVRSAKKEEQLLGQRKLGPNAEYIILAKDVR